MGNFATTGNRRRNFTRALYLNPGLCPPSTVPSLYVWWFARAVAHGDVALATSY